ncbi:type II toxin-antitoxin system Phd/YefM family antitoxin [Aquincola tertiaricarbonis]|uniref:Type II toxin-antitoxin system Phd/YefM family antitoxin n=1 Tax=Aquincola tertiaricarbonis TaxID=391953 RepID=A0ABY4RZH5_AQUTE|nr:type II toxin-antitoxin system Phd/YefM family antitoxin [Aquincola tertiaricarbonis]URI06338.1 type II toxin-antitoxin system Phd/YefM family antitoxin [Aquincola tertiaricarbonis]
MNKVIGMHEAKSTLSQLVARAAGGETILIGPHGRAEAKLVPVDAPQPKKIRIGAMKGRLTVPDDFNEPLPDDVLQGFEGML